MILKARKVITLLTALIGFLLFSNAFYVYVTHDYYQFITSYAYNHGWSESSVWNVYISSAIRFTLRLCYVVSFIGLFFFQRWSVYLCLIAWLGQLLPSMIMSYMYGHGIDSGHITSFISLLVYIGAIAFCWPVLKPGHAILFCMSALAGALLIHTAAFFFLFNTLAALGGHGGNYDAAKQDLLWKYTTSKDAEALKALLDDKSFHPVLRGLDCDENTICNLISYAAEDGSLEIVKMLHKAGSPIDEQDGGTGDTPTIRALIAGYADVAEYLAQSGADPLQTNRFGVPAFIAAATEGSPLLLEIMIKSGAPVNLRRHMPDMITNEEGKIVDGVTPLMMAASSGRLDLIETLLKHGADPSLKDEANHDIYDYAKSGRAPAIENRIREIIENVKE